MAQVKIVTDSIVHLDPALIAQYDVSVLPMEIRFGDESFLIGPNEVPHRLFRKMMAGPVEPIEASLSRTAVREVYRQLCRETDEILVILSSQQLSGAYKAAVDESRPFLGRCRIAVMDSMSTSWGLGLVVQAAAEAAAQNKTLDQIIRLVRGMLPHIYIVLIADRLDYLERGGRIGAAQALLGSMLHIKPLLIVEDGEVIPLEKVRTRVMAIDKLADFVAEFASVQQAVVLESPLGDGTEDLVRALDERLGQRSPRLRFPIINYDALLACHVGPVAIGVIVYEGD